MSKGEVAANSRKHPAPLLVTKKWEAVPCFWCSQCVVGIVKPHFLGLWPFYRRNIPFKAGISALAHLTYMASEVV